MFLKNKIYKQKTLYLKVKTDLKYFIDIKFIIII